MKTKIFILAVAACLISTLALNAQKSNNLFTNVSNTSTGTVKEITSFNETTSKPEYRKVHVYDLSGKREKMAYYEWNDKSGWIEIQSHTYKYTDGKLASVSFIKKDEKNGKWSPMICNLIYTYDQDGTLLSMEKIIAEDIIHNTLVQN